MEINKQLFEDVLSGKLKGTFVLRNGTKFDSSSLRYDIRINRPYSIGEIRYYENGLSYRLEICEYDIINFIPDTDMKENELMIEIPEGKIVDWDESKKQNKIVLKDKQLTYEDVCKKYLGNDFYLIKHDGSIGYILDNRNTPKIAILEFYNNTPNCSKTQHQLECILAKNKLATVAKYLNNGWKRDYHNRDFGYFICKLPKEIEIVKCDNYRFSNNVIFKSRDLAQQAIEILGEETVKLALEPLGI